MQEASTQWNIAVTTSEEMNTLSKNLRELPGQLQRFGQGMGMRGKSKPTEAEGMGSPEKWGSRLGTMLMGPKGFGEKGGIKDQLKGMATSLVPMGGALKAGGMVGAGIALVGGILGIIKQAFGASSIWNGVAGQFFKIAGYMMDMLLMPMLPHMMKFLQWMMTSVLPVVMRVSQAIADLLKGNAAPLVQAIFMGLIKAMVYSLTSFWPTVIKVLAKAIGSAINPFNYGGGGGGGGGGSYVGGDMNAANRKYGSSSQSAAEKASRDLNRFVDTDAAKNKSFFDKWSWSMFKGSLLPEIQDSIHGFFDGITDAVGGVWDSIWSWISSRGDWLGDVWGSLKEKFWSVIHVIGGFFTGKDTEGSPVEHSIPGYIGKAVDGVTSGIGSSVLFLGDLWDKIWTKVKEVWGEWAPGGEGIRGWIYDNTVAKIPSWDTVKDGILALGGKIIDIGGSIRKWWSGDEDAGTSGVWGQWKAGGGGIRGWIYDRTIAKIPTWSRIEEGIQDIGAAYLDLGAEIGAWFGNVWGQWDEGGGGIRGWIYDNTMAKLPSMDEVIKSVQGIFLSLGLATQKMKMVSDESREGADISWIKGDFKMKSLWEDISALGGWIGTQLQNLWDMLPEINMPNISWPDLTWIKDIGGLLIGKIAESIYGVLTVESGNWAQNGWKWVVDNFPGLEKLRTWAEGHLTQYAATSGHGSAPSSGGGMRATGPATVQQPVAGAGGRDGDDPTAATGSAYGTQPWTGGNDIGDLGHWYQTGGFVPGVRGKARAGVLHGGEYVVPAHLASGNSYMNNMVNQTSPSRGQYVDQKNFNITINSTWSPADLVNDLSNIKDMNNSSYFNALGA